MRSGHLEPRAGESPWIIKFDGVTRESGGQHHLASAGPGPWGRIEYVYSVLARRAGEQAAAALGGGAGFSGAGTLWGSLDNYKKYDMVLMASTGIIGVLTDEMALAEPKRLRQRLLHVAARICRTARRSARMIGRSGSISAARSGLSRRKPRAFSLP